MSFDLAAFRTSLLADPLIHDVWRDKYRYGAESSQSDTLRRVADALYIGDPSQESKTEALNLMLAGHLIPAGRIIAGAGTGRAVTLINCYVNETVQDSIPGIQRAISRAAFTMQQGGGIGTDWSTVRPAGAVVRRTGSVSSGMLPFMDQMDAMCRTVSSAGTRRGAMMGTLRDDHPDLLDFIRAKRMPGRLTQFNVSVLVSQWLMNAVAEDKEWDLGFHVPRADGNHIAVRGDKSFPYDAIDYDNEYHVTNATLGRSQMPWYVYQRVRARDLWDELMRSTYTYAEPGVIFIDRVNERNNLNYCEEIRCTNPCFTGDTRVWTIDGPKRFDELAVNTDSVRVLTLTDRGSVCFETMHRPRLTQRNAKLVLVTLEFKQEGQPWAWVYTTCTPGHEWFLKSEVKRRADELLEGDELYHAYQGNLGSDFSLRVQSVKHIPTRANVYCGTVPGTGRFFIQFEGTGVGALVSNCGEQPLPPNGQCDLGSVNLAGLVRHPFTSHARFDNDTYKRAIAAGVRLLDNVLDVTNYPLEAQREEAHAKRRIGLGVTGFADCLLQLGITYGSEASVKMANDLSWTLREYSYLASAKLANERGSFPLYDAEKIQESHNVQRLTSNARDLIRLLGLRNGVLNTVAPNGTITLAFAGNSGSGIEPVFAFEKASRKVRQADESFVVYETVNYSYRLWEALHGPTPRDRLPPYFVGAMDVAPEAHVRVQAAWQEHIDSSISKTINCATDLTYDEFKNVYTLAYELGCKGCTTYRFDPAAGRGSVLALAEEAPGHTDLMVSPEAIDEALARFKADINDASAQIGELSDDFRNGMAFAEATFRQNEADQKELSPMRLTAEVRGRPHRADGSTYKIKWPLTGSNWYVTVTRDDAGAPLELFISTRETDQQEWVQALSCTITAILRRGGDFRFLIQELKQVSAATGAAFLQIGDNAEHPTRYPSVVAAIGAVLDAETKRLSSGGGIMQTVMTQAIAEVASGFNEAATDAERRARAVVSRVLDCPTCGASPLVHESGCGVCKTCGYSECG